MPTQPKRTTATRPRNRAAQDATLINIRPLKRRITLLEQSERALWLALSDLQDKQGKLHDRLAVCENAIALAQQEHDE